jgi:ADP-dependent NAD(P)H-hydrate dehydratase / NAD(P)H-hydrate epimerase
VKNIEENTPRLWRRLFPFPDAKSHKYSRGTALIRGGDQMTGAARLAARAAQRAGAGLVVLASPQSALSLYAEALESVIVRPCDTLDVWKEFVSDAKHPALLIGPGLKPDEKVREEVLTALKAKRPCVLDAGALMAFSNHSELLFEHLHEECVLTPHEGEFEKLFGASESERIEKITKASQKTRCTVLLKGSETLIANSKGDIIINRNAPPWLATAGSGDVLAGIILGLVAQKMPVFLATAAAAWIHGRCGEKHGIGLIAEDIINILPLVLQELFSLS